MLTCIACSKQLDDGDDQDAQRSGTPATVKSLSSQIKDMVLKFSGVYRQCKPSTTSSPSSSSLSKSQRYSSYVAVGDEGPVQDARSGRWKNQPCMGVSVGMSGQDGFKMNPYEVWSQGNPQREAVDTTATAAVVEEVFEEAREWVAQVEPGVHITFLALPQGGNDLKRIRFREMFNKWQAQRWWGENYDKVMELYNVQRFNRQALPTPPRSEDERSSPYSGVESTEGSPTVTPRWSNDPLAAAVVTTSAGSRAPTATSTTTVDATKTVTMFQKPSHDETAAAEKPVHPHNNSGSAGSGATASCAATSVKGDVVSGEASRTTSSRDKASASASNASDMEVNEWVEQDEPGVYITVRQQPDGTRELRRVRFSRERFGEVHAKLWWEENRERIHAQYL